MGEGPLRTPAYHLSQGARGHLSGVAGRPFRPSGTRPIQHLTDGQNRISVDSSARCSGSTSSAAARPERTYSLAHARRRALTQTHAQILLYLALATTGVDSDSRHRVRRPEPNSFEGGGHTHTLSLTQSHCTLSVSDSLLGSTHSLMSSPFPSTLVEKCSWSKSTAAAVDDSSLQLDRRLGGELCTDESPTP